MAWAHILGQDLAIAQIQRAFAQDRLAHAYFLVGPEGVGKRLFALQLTKSVLCHENQGQLDSCDRCPACRQVAAFTHPDFLFAQKPEDKMELPTAVVRELCVQLGLKASRGQRKIAILEDADDFNEESANCFLKTLEEPPSQSLLLLIARSTERQLPTILSRTQIIRFRPLTAEPLHFLLAQQGVEDEELRSRVISMCQGSVSRALAMQDPELWNFQQHTLGFLFKPTFDPASMIRLWLENIESAGKEAPPQRQRATLLLEMLLHLLRQHLLEIQHDSIEQEYTIERMEACLDAIRNIERRVPVPLVVEQLMDRWCLPASNGVAHRG